MNRRPLFLATLVLAALPAFAQQAAPAPAVEPAPVATPDTPAPAAMPTPIVDANAAAIADAEAHPNCLRETGTLIRARSRSGNQGCANHGPGRVYTQDDLRSTGQTDIADALRMLDPSIH
ncbi:hypothetical protein [Lysobacter sp. HA18]